MKFSTPAQAIKEHIEISNPEGIRGAISTPSSDMIWPVVRWMSGKEMICVPQEFTVNNADGGMEACRQQVRSLSLHTLTLYTKPIANSYPLSWHGLLAYINLRVRPSSGSRSTLSEPLRKVKVR